MAMTTPPDGRQQHEHVELGPVELLPAQVAVGRAGRRGRPRPAMSTVKKTVKPSTDEGAGHGR